MKDKLCTKRILVMVWIAGIIVCFGVWTQQKEQIGYKEKIEDWKKDLFIKTGRVLGNSIYNQIAKSYGLNIKEETEQWQEVNTETYRVIRGEKRMENGTTAVYPILEIKEREIEEQWNPDQEYEAYIVDYTITYADAQYFSIRYRDCSNSIQTEMLYFSKFSSNPGIRRIYRGFWIDTRGTQPVFCEPIFLRGVSKMLQENSIDNLIAESMSYYLTEDGIGCVIENEDCIEWNYDWKKEKIEEDPVLPLEKEERQKQIDRNSKCGYFVEELIEDFTEYGYRVLSQVHYPRIRGLEEEKNERLNHILYSYVDQEGKEEQKNKLYHDFYAVDYEITYADECYLCVLYKYDYKGRDRERVYYNGIFLDLERGEERSIKDMGISEDIGSLFLEATHFYTDNIFFTESLLSEQTKEKIVDEWKKWKHSFYFREEKIGYIFYTTYRGNICVEIESDWMKNQIEEYKNRS